MTNCDDCGELTDKPTTLEHPHWIVCPRCASKRTKAPRSVVDDLRDLLRESKRQHYHCDDSWYCCPRCDCPDHPSGPPSLGAERTGKDECDCGATKWSAKVDAALGETT